MLLHALDWTMIAVYFAAMGYLGFYFSHKNQDTEQYFLGGRSFRGWVIGLSMVGTSISSVSFLAYPADAYRTAWLRMIPNFAMPFAAVAALYVFIPLFRSKRRTTAYQYLGERFGKGIRIYGGCAYILTQFIRLGIVLFLVGTLLETMTGGPLWICIIVAGIVVASYTIVGGFSAVVWTDVIQTVVLVFGGLVVFLSILAEIPGGLSQIIDISVDDAKLSFSELQGDQLVPIGWGWALSEKTGLMMLILGLTTWLQEFATDQNVVQRYCAAASDSEARKAVWWSVLSRLPIWGFFMFLGTALYVFFQLNPSDAASAMLSGEQKPEGILPYFVTNHLPVGVAGIVIAGAIAAAMSSLDSSMNAISAVFVTDLYRTDRERDDKRDLAIAHYVTLVAAIVMVGLAMLLAFSDTKTIQDVWTILVSIFGGGILGLFCFGIFTTWGDGRAAGCGIVATVCYTIYIVLSQRGFISAAPFDIYYSTIIGNLLMFSVTAVASLSFGRSSTGSLAGLTIWTIGDVAKSQDSRP